MTDRELRVQRRALARTMMEHDPVWAEVRRQREERALLGAAWVLSGRRDRAEIRAIARRSSGLVTFYSHLWKLDGLEPLKAEGLDHLEHAVARGRGAIVAPYHFGPYRWLAPSLAAWGYRLAFLVDSANTPRLVEDMRARFPPLAASYVEYINSELPTALWDLRRKLVRGDVVIMFADGNSGMDNRPVDHHCLQVPLFDRMVSIRAGIAALAGAARAPIIPVFTEDRGRRPPLARFHEPIEIAPDEKQTAFRVRAMRALVALLERELERRPQRWEEWWLLPSWVSSFGSGEPAPSHHDRISSDDLAGQRLTLVDPGLWRIPLRGVDQAIDLRRGISLGSDVTLLDVIDAVEQGQPADEWLRTRADQATALYWIRALIGMELIALRPVIA